MTEIRRGGFFITLEGTEGVGKSTQARLLAENLSRRGYQVLQTREPGGTVLGESLRATVKQFRAADPICAASEVLLFAASRAQLVETVVLPHLRCGGVVVCDRFVDSTTAYQGYGRGIPLDFIGQLHAFTTGGRLPDLTLILDLPVEAGLSRIRGPDGGRDGLDRIESEGRAFHEAVRRGFLALATAEPARVRLVDASGPMAVVHKHIMEIVDRVLR